VVLVTLVLSSAVVLRHEQRILEEELVTRAELVARTVAVSVADAGAPELLAVVSLAEVRAGEARRPGGEVVWRYGPSLAEATEVDGGAIRVVRRVELPGPPGAASDEIDVELLVSRSGIARRLTESAIRVVGALGLALTATFLAGLAFVGRFVDPLRRLASIARSFDPDRGRVELPAVHGTTAEVDDLARAFRDMVARIDADRRKLAASERRYRELFAGSPTPLLEVDRELRVRDANPAATVLLGGAAAGEPLLASLGTPDRERIAARLAETLDAGGGVVEARWTAPDETAAELELHLRPVGDGTALVAVHDLTERVRRLAERWQRTFDAMTDGVALLDPDGAVAAANRAVAGHLDDLRREASTRLGDAPADWRTSSRGRVLDCILTRPPELGLAVLVVRDSTEQVRAEERLRDAEKMEAIGRLARGVAHDFNNLLAGIQLHGRVLERTASADREAVAAIRELADEGEEVVRELLLFARSESTPPRPLDLAALVSAQEGLLSHLLPPSVLLEVSVGARPVPVVANPVALRRLLLNLALNARDAVADRGGRVAIRVASDRGRAVLEVEDDGPGIDDDCRGRLFEPFFSQRRGGRGAGLGLAVVYAIAREHGGGVEVRSEPGAGSCFAVDLPLAADAELEPEAPPPAPPVRVLLLEPEGRAADRLLRELAAAGFDLRHAVGEAAGRHLAREWRPQVVVAAVPAGEPPAWLAGLGVPVVWLGGAGDPAGPVLSRQPDPGTVAAEVRRVVRA